MTKIWFSIEMTFNTSLFVSLLLLLLLLLPNAKYVSMKRTAPKNMTAEKPTSGKGFQLRLFQRTSGQNKTATNRTTSTTTSTASPFNITEEDPDILEYEDDEDLEFDNSIIEDSIAHSNDNSTDNSTEGVTSHDYEINSEEIMATEPPELESFAELVDENGQVEQIDEDETENHEESEDADSTPFTTVIGPSTMYINTIDNNTLPVTTPQPTTKKAKFGELRKGDQIKSGLKHIYQQTVVQKQLKKNLTEQARKRNCLNFTQDSGFWCEGTVGRLEIKYYYEKASETCECFLYYGCLGNKNNFDSIKECEDSCKPFASKAFKRQKASSVVCTIVP